MQSGRNFGHLPVVDGAADTPECGDVQSDCHSVTREADPIAAALERGLNEWRRDRDPQALRRVLARLLSL